MANIVFSFDSGLELNYSIIECESSAFFLKGIAQMSLDNICATSFKTGFDSTDIIDSKIFRLYTVANEINALYPKEITIVPLFPNWKLALHQMHTHFPDLTSRISKQELISVISKLGEFNDLIHWLDKELERKYNGSELNKSWATLCLDFNRAADCPHLPIPVADYQLFTHKLYFGNLHLHYDNVGRHPWELFSSNDYQCPMDQVISQNQISPSCNLYFNDWDILRLQKKVQPLHLYQQRFEKFYQERGGISYFGYEIDDPRLAVGYMKIGQLLNLAEYSNLAARQKLRSTLARSSLIGWKIL